MTAAVRARKMVITITMYLQVWKRKGGALEQRLGRNPLATASYLGFIGDLHGDVGHLLEAVRALHSSGVKVAIVTGDFGFVWPGVNYKRTLDKLGRRLTALGVTLYFVDGNHEWFPELDSYSSDGDGLRRLRTNIIHLPRGYRVVLASGKVLAALGGANSIDREEREKGSDWWPSESITEEDLSALGYEHADLLVGHDAPVRVPSLDWALAANTLNLTDEMLAYSLAGRRLLTRGVMAVRPSVFIGGHYHRFADELVEFDCFDSPFSVRVVILDQVGPRHVCLAVLDVESLELDFGSFTSLGANVSRGGRSCDDVSLA